MPRNLMIFADGTAMVGGLRPEESTSNVYKLYTACRAGHQSPVPRTEQLAFYHAGLGAKIENGAFPNPLSALRRLTNLAMGAGITTHIVDCYETILRHYQPGDRIFLIGFSRGAYTVRNVANVLNLCGIPEYNRSGKPFARSGPEPRKIAAEAVNIYEHGAGKERKRYEEQREIRAWRFREAHGSWHNYNKKDPNKNRSNVTPYFIGAFDAVAALGLGGTKRLIVLTIATLLLALATLLTGEFIEELLGISWLNAVIMAFLVITTGLFLKFGLSRLRVIRQYPEKDKPSIFRKPGRLLPVVNFSWHFVSWKFKHFDRYLDRHVPYARHAIAINEKRADFDRVPWGIIGDRSKSVMRGEEDGPEWFRQVWFAGDHTDIGGGYPYQEAGLSDISLQWMSEQLRELPNKPHLNEERLQCDPDPLAPQHCSVKSLKYMYPEWWPKKLRFSWPTKTRKVPNDAPLHPSVLIRYKAPEVLQEGERKPYRPTNLQDHRAIKTSDQ